jgi:hypothetical protein
LLSSAQSWATLRSFQRGAASTGTVALVHEGAVSVVNGATTPLVAGSGKPASTIAVAPTSTCIITCAGEISTSAHAAISPTDPPGEAEIGSSQGMAIDALVGSASNCPSAQLPFSSPLFLCAPSATTTPLHGLRWGEAAQLAEFAPEFLCVTRH